MNNVGEIVLGTKVDNSGLKSGLKETERIAENFDNSLDLNGIKLNVDDEEGMKVLETMINMLKDRELQDATIEPKLGLRKIKEGKVEILTEMSSLVEELNENMSINPKLDDSEIMKYILKLDNLIDKYNELEMEQDELNNKGFQGVNLKLDQVGNKITSVIRKIGRWALALVGVQTAISLVTKAFSTLSEYSQDLRDTVSSIRLVLAVAFENVINKIISMIVTVLNYVNYLSKAWFGVDLFARASALSTKKMADNMGSAAGSAAEMRKQLAGFDEMNVLGDNVGAAGGGGGGISTPDFSGFYLDQNVKIPEWLKWIKDNGQAVALILGAIGAALLAIKLAPFLAALTGATTPMAAFAAGVALIAAGLVLLVGEIINLVFNWDNMDNKQKALAIGLAALGAAMIALGVAMAAGFSAATLGIGLVVAAIVAAIAWVGSFIAKVYDEEKAIQDANYYQDQYNEAKKRGKQATDDYLNAIDEEQRTLKNLQTAQQETGLSGEVLNKAIENGTRNYKDYSDEEKKVVRAYRDHEAAAKTVTEKEKSMKKANVDTAAAAELAGKNYKEYGKVMKKAMDDGTYSSKEMHKKVKDDMKGMDTATRETFVNSLPKSIRKGFDFDEYATTWNSFQRKFALFLGSLSGNIKVNLDVILKGGASSLLKNKNGAIFYDLKSMPRLASGGVINRPGRGVPVGSAVGGEAGREGVLPLTDSRAMALLGKEIGRWITLNATIPVSIGNRQVAREIKQMMADDDFATNS